LCCFKATLTVLSAAVRVLNMLSCQSSTAFAHNSGLVPLEGSRDKRSGGIDSTRPAETRRSCGSPLQTAPS
jgi:hypothetical protein